jgi:hypothetical protein
MKSASLIKAGSFLMTFDFMASGEEYGHAGRSWMNIVRVISTSDSVIKACSFTSLLDRTMDVSDEYNHSDLEEYFWITYDMENNFISSEIPLIDIEYLLERDVSNEIPL